ncbi:Extracellular basic protease precursor [Dermatophilus congolensis]|uniref:Extracellular basic protease n=1 Tax=Dermatophilus congolensis TaxID=1863 RepID=A0AA46BPV4_9MICO|nr:S8 family peptidase [Dermatophilus congolensis]STD13925.1 Extracellular basic protease precursor [Dermatophilus congolensis]
MRRHYALGIASTLALALAPLASASAAPKTPTPPPTPAPTTKVAYPQTAPSTTTYTGDIVVTFKNPSPAAKADALDRVNKKHAASLTVKRSLGSRSRAVVTGTSTARAAHLAQAMVADPNIVAAEPDIRVHASEMPNDPLYASSQWDLKNGPAGINAPTAWKATSGQGVTVAVIDTGITRHPDLDSQLVPGYDFISSPDTARDRNGRDNDPSDMGDWSTYSQCFRGSQPRDSSWHGTHVAGTVAAIANNGTGVAGVAYGARIQPVRVLGGCGGSLSDIADAVTWASGGKVEGAPTNPTPSKVLNLSLGGPGYCYSYMQASIDGAVSRGSTVVVAAGNKNTDASTFSPANCHNVITVGATGGSATKSSFSNYGNTVTLSAPGGEATREPNNQIISTVNSGTTTPAKATYGPMVGTSQATPHVAAVAAMLSALSPSMTPEQIKTTLVNTTHPFAVQPNVPMGSGILDAAKAVAAITGNTPIPTPVPVPTEPNPSGTAPKAVNDTVALAPYTTHAKVNVLKNDTTTNPVSKIELLNPPCTRKFCLTVNPDKTIGIRASLFWHGNTAVQYTFTQEDGQTGTATLTVKA